MFNASLNALNVVSEILERYKEETGTPHAKVAKRMGISKQSLSMGQVSRTGPRVEHTAKLCEATGYKLCVAKFNPDTLTFEIEGYIEPIPDEI